MGDIHNALHQAMQSLQPVHLELVNESFMHSVPPGSESHFKAVIVSDEFTGLHTYTPAEWNAREQAPDSPNCLGGGKTNAKANP